MRTSTLSPLRGFVQLKSGGTNTSKYILRLSGFTKPSVALNLEAAHDFGALPLEHFHHVAHRAAVAGAAQAHPHHVALHGKLAAGR